MEKIYAIEVCCPNCAAKMEAATKKVEGVADAAPLSDKEHDGCKYCKMRPICRRRKE